MGKNIVDHLEELMAEIKEEALTYVFDLIEIYIAVSKEHRKELSFMVLGKVLHSQVHLIS
jgi:hypothetical protein